jgi:AcrR family transcriptional regulator
MHQNGKAVVHAGRDPDRTRRRILAAALVEFSTKGFAGARVDAIARRARGNKRMLYHYFGNKKGLFGAVLRHNITERAQWGAQLPDDPGQCVALWFQSACNDADWVRLLEWEALQNGGGKFLDYQERLASVGGWLQGLRRRQEKGTLTTAYDSGHLALVLLSLTLFPMAFPQLVRLYTGESVTSPQFQCAYGKFLRKFAQVFNPRVSSRK